MESQYHQVESLDRSSVYQNTTKTVFVGMKRIVIFVLYGLLVLLLLILLLVTGIKFSQLSREITDLKQYLGKTNHGGTTSALGSGKTTVHSVALEELTPIRGTCSEGWVSYQSSCYLVSITSITWSKAEEQCKAHGGHLLVLNTAEELDYISRIVPIKYAYWIGLVERHHEGQWSWVDGTDYRSTPTFWDEGQPDDWDYRENGEDCGQLHPSERRERRLWNDADCNIKFHYICEKRA
ncbi:C-type lectin domain family 4 member E isoform X1 [Oreochromis niloticus]|uniref:C-type lectin domain family 4 member E isoform X1 n=1 Tax=Oreochromis niloticus TaxID=8128 RepID=UPI000393F5EA|nr:C-type lectin domain family 4 member E isoform X1 [Oreochromis niloticus]